MTIKKIHLHSLTRLMDDWFHEEILTLVVEMKIVRKREERRIQI